VVSFTPGPLYSQGKNPWYLLDRRLDGPQSQFERGDEEKNSQPLAGLEPPIVQPVVQCCTTELSRLLCCLWSNDDHVTHLTWLYTNEWSEISLLWSEGVKNKEIWGTMEMLCEDKCVRQRKA
jgi:hypothetical protein